MILLSVDQDQYFWQLTGVTCVYSIIAAGTNQQRFPDEPNEKKKLTFRRHHMSEGWLLKVVLERGVLWLMTVRLTGNKSVCEATLKVYVIDADRRIVT